MAAVIIRMVADEIDLSRRKKDFNALFAAAVDGYKLFDDGFFCRVIRRE